MTIGGGPVQPLVARIQKGIIAAKRARYLLGPDSFNGLYEM